MKPVYAVLALLASSACVSIPDVDDLVVAEPVNCETAQRDLVALDQMRPTLPRSSLVLLSTLTPGGLVAGIVSNDMQDRARVFDGSFARELEAKKATIRQTCDLPEASGPILPDARETKKAPPAGEAS